MNRGNIGLCTKEEDIVPVYGEFFIPALKQSQRYGEAISHLRYLYQDINDLRQRYVSLGYHLCEYDRFQLWNRLGFTNIFDFAEANLGLHRTTVSHCMNIVKMFSGNGSPNSISIYLNEKYKDFSYSQLCEMVSMGEKDRRKVKPEMTIRQIRELKKAAKKTDQNAIDSLKNTLDLAQATKKSLDQFDQQMKEKYHADQEQAEQIPGRTSIEADFPEYLPDGQAKPVATSQQKKKDKSFIMSEYNKLKGAARSAYIKSRDQVEENESISIHFFDSNGVEIFPEVFGLWGRVIYSSCGLYYVRLDFTKKELDAMRSIEEGRS